MLRYIILIFFLLTENSPDENFFYTNNGTISFRSDAPQEVIKAASTNLAGILDTKNRTFVFKVLIRTFKGFNSALQQEHFNEKYLESEKFPEAHFIGKIIENLDLSVDGTYDVRAKGKLYIHGVEVEKIIRSNVNVKNGLIKIDSQFNIILSDFNIKIPKVVHEKIANEIIVDISGELTKKNKIEN